MKNKYLDNPKSLKALDDVFSEEEIKPYLLKGEKSIGIVDLIIRCCIPKEQWVITKPELN